MGRVRQKNTEPELVVRKFLTGKGYRYRLHRRDLPGSPDIVFVSRRKVIFVHGCFWHRHVGCRSKTTPTTRKKFWENKFSANIERDARNIHELKEMGWAVFVIWGCETKDMAALESSLLRFLQH